MEDDLCKDIMKRILNLKDADIQIYRELVKVRSARVSEISKMVGKDRTTVQRSLNRLVKAGLCSKERKVLDGGGYFYIYVMKKPEDIRSILEDCLERWYAKLKERIKIENALL